MPTKGARSIAAMLEKFDAMPPTDALTVAWTHNSQDATVAMFHRACKAEVRRLMPLVARAIDRVVAERDMTGMEG